MGPHPVTGILVKRGLVGRNITGRTPRGDEDRDQGDVPTSQGAPKMVVDHQKLERVWNKE